MAIASREFRELRLEQISRDFGQVRALRDVSLTVGRGEFVALLGPSGCGKSTALNCIAGLLQVTGGAIWLDERRLDEAGPEDRGFGMVFQNYALFPHMTVRRNVGFGLVTQRRPKAEIARRVDQALALVRLETQADKLPGQLSGGQQQRVAIARAIVVEPPLVLMDEPLSNLDAKLRLEMRAEIRRIHTMLGCSTIYVTHDQEEALSLADRILVMIDGQTRQLGTPEELYARPAHADVAEFMGYRNLFPCRAETTTDGFAVTIGPARLQATPMDAVGGAAVAAIRPDDLRPQSDGPISATVEIAEYHGRDFYAVARGADGTELYFRSPMRVNPGEPVRLAAPRDRVLVYAA
jgi:putative spermidine/putrescine transport system ATP-binding protein